MSERARKSKIHQIDGLQETLLDIFNATKYEKVLAAPGGVMTLTPNALGIYKFELTLAEVLTPSINIGGGAKDIKDLDGVIITSLEKGHYEVIADATFFTLRSRGNKGFDPLLTAAAGTVLDGETFSINGKDILVGSMPNRGSLNLTPTDSIQNGAAGYYSGITVAARPVLSGDAAVGHVLETKTFYNSTYTKQTGTMVNRAGSNGSLATSAVATTITMRPPAGYYDGVDDVVTTVDADFIAANFLDTKNLYGLQGGIPSKGAQTYTPGTTNQTIALGQYLSGVQTIAGDADLIAANIVDTANIFNVQGTAKSVVGQRINWNREIFESLDNLALNEFDLVTVVDGVITAYQNTALTTITKKTFNASGTVLTSTTFDTLTSMASRQINTPRRDVMCYRDSALIMKEFTTSGTLLFTSPEMNNLLSNSIRLVNGTYFGIYSSSEARLVSSAGAILAQTTGGSQLSTYGPLIQTSAGIVSHTATNSWTALFSVSASAASMLSNTYTSAILKHLNTLLVSFYNY